MFYSFHKNIKQHNYIDLKKKCILEWFLKDHVALKTGVMMLKNTALHHRNKFHFKMYLNRKQLF